MVSQYILLELFDSKAFPKKSPINHQQLLQQRINHMIQLVKKDITHHKLLLLREEKNLSFSNKNTHDLTFYNLPFSIHPINKSFVLLNSLWASLPLNFEMLLFRYTQWWDAHLFAFLSLEVK